MVELACTLRALANQHSPQVRGSNVRPDHALDVFVTTILPPVIQVAPNDSWMQYNYWYVAVLEVDGEILEEHVHSGLGAAISIHPSCRIFCDAAYTRGHDCDSGLSCFQYVW